MVRTPPPSPPYPNGIVMMTEHPVNGGLLVVTNDQIRLPIIVQNRRNRHAFVTYAFTIDLVPLVLEKSCFAGHIFKYKWKTYQMAQIEGVK
jgi:hypothetical protein